jgi:phosphoglycerate dehydrogenase-like enzyme
MPSSISGDPSSFAPRHVLVAGTAHGEVAAALGERLDGVEVRGVPLDGVTLADLDWADTYVGFRHPPAAAAVGSMGQVRWVHCTGAGVDAWLYPMALAPSLLLTRTDESFGPMIAEWAVGRARAFTQRLLPLAAHQRRHEWSSRSIEFVRGTHAVIVGTGDVGSHIGRAFAALGARVLGVSRSGRGDRAVFSTVHTADRLRDIVPSADWLVLALPLTSETDGLVSAEVLDACRGAILINAGRGAVVDEAAIPRALDRGALRGAALDVFTVEPLPRTSPLWDDERVMVSPHLSGPTTVDGAVGGFVACVAALAARRWPALTVDRRRGY